MPAPDDGSIPDVPLYPRGVFISRIRARDGALVVFAVDSEGRIAGKIPLRGMVTAEAATRILRARLDEEDPLPVLTLSLSHGGARG